MSEEVLKATLDGLFAEVAAREATLRSAVSNHEHRYIKNGFHLAEFYARNVSLIRETKKLKAIISEVSFILHSKRLYLQSQYAIKNDAIFNQNQTRQ